MIGALEGAAATLVFGSGMSAAIALFLSLPQGAHIVAPRVMYWALRNWLDVEAPLHGLDVDFVDDRGSAATRRRDPAGAHQARLAGDAEQSALGRSATSPPPRRLAHAAGAILAVDSTCATPVFTRRSRSAPTS